MTWPLSAFPALLPSKMLRTLALTFLGSTACAVLPQFLIPYTPFILAAQAQAQSTSESATPAGPPPAPTARYARGENVDLAEIVSEWRGYYADVPVYLCICQDATCDQTRQWPYREFDRYQLTVALGPTGGQLAEDTGANCFDIADGSRPSKARSFSAAQRQPNTPVIAAPPPRPTAPPRPAPPANTPASPPVPTAPPVAPPPTAPPPIAPPPAQSAASSAPTPPVPTAATNNSGAPIATSVNNGSAIRLLWPSGATNVIDIVSSNWNLNVLDATDCNILGRVEQKTLEAQRIVSSPVVDSVTGNVAVPVLLDSCVDSDQSAVFILDANEGGGYALYRLQLPGNRNLPNEFSTFPLSTITGLSYWDGSLLVRHGDASGAEAIVVFRSDQNPAGKYAGCGIVREGEGAGRLCPE